MPRRLVYGPVASRRFGLSLGVDPLPPKTCSFDCVYCQQGRTTTLTTTRRAFVPVADVVAQIEAALARGPAPDVITLAGSGEPTLYLPLGELIDAIHGLGPAPVVLLTNGSLFTDPDVRAQAGRADVLGPSLDAGDERTYQRINRPHPTLEFETFVSGLRAMRAEARGRYDLEVLIARGFNDSPDQLRALAALAVDIGADSIQLNTAVRPVPGSEPLALTRDEMERILPLFGPTATIIASFESWSPGSGAADPEGILATLGRRPCTVAELSTALGQSEAELEIALAKLEHLGRVQRTQDGYWHPSRGG